MDDWRKEWISEKESELGLAEACRLMQLTSNQEGLVMAILGRQGPPSYLLCWLTLRLLVVIDSSINELD